MLIKISLKDLKKDDLCQKIEHKLENDSENAYTVIGLLVEVLNVKENSVKNKPFKDWPNDLRTMYSKINTCLVNLKSRGLVKSTKHGKDWVYWYSLPKN